MRVACLISGGKDSLYSCYLAERDGHEIEYLIGLVSENPDSYMFQQVDEDDLKEVSERMGVPIVIEHTPGEKEKELDELREAVKEVAGDVEGLVSGAVASSYQRDRIEEICEEAGLETLTPLWDRDPETVLREMLDAGFEIEIVKTAAGGLDESYVGRQLDGELLEELKEIRKEYGIHLMGEGGEYETRVIDCPLFRD